MSGLLAALLLRRAGWDVDVYERVESELAGRGAGIVAQPDLIATLRRLRDRSDRPRRRDHDAPDPRCVRPAGRRVRVSRRCSPPGSGSTGRCGMHFRRSAITAAAASGLRRRREQVGGRAFRRRRHAPRAISSSAPTGFAPPSASNACPNWRRSMPATWPGARSLPEAAFPPAIHRELFNFMTFCLPPGEQCLGYPVAGPDNDLRPGHRRYNVVWYRPADESGRVAAAAHRRKRHDPHDLDPAAADPARGDRRTCAPPPSGCWRRNSARSCA